ncbi:hypothetical protein CYMTET_13604, partial [Cymbomonas tetramitiformis]
VNEYIGVESLKFARLFGEGDLQFHFDQILLMRDPADPNRLQFGPQEREIRNDTEPRVDDVDRANGDNDAEDNDDDDGDDDDDDDPENAARDAAFDARQERRERAADEEEARLLNDNADDLLPEDGEMDGHGTVAMGLLKVKCGC